MPGSLRACVCVCVYLSCSAATLISMSERQQVLTYAIPNRHGNRAVAPGGVGEAEAVSCLIITCQRLHTHTHIFVLLFYDDFC